MASTCRCPVCAPVPLILAVTLGPEPGRAHSRPSLWCVRKLMPAQASQGVSPRPPEALSRPTPEPWEWGLHHCSLPVTVTFLGAAGVVVAVTSVWGLSVLNTGPLEMRGLRSPTDTMEEPASGPESPDGLLGPALPCGLGQDQEPLRRLGLTKEVLAAHTQKEEQSFLLKFKETRRCSALQSRCRHFFKDRPQGRPSEGGRWPPGFTASECFFPKH